LPETCAVEDDAIQIEEEASTQRPEETPLLESFEEAVVESRR